VLDRPECQGKVPPAITAAVVAEHPFNGDAPFGEEPRGPGPKGRCRGPLLVGEDLLVGQSTEAIDGGVHIGVPDPCLASLVLLRAPVSSPAPSLRNPSQLLDIDVDQLTRS